MQQIVFKVGSHIFRAQLNAQTPNICKRLLNHLPVSTFAVHAKFAGDEIITMVPFYSDPENEILDVTAGDIGYYPGRQTFCLFYGDVKPFGAVSVFASLVKPLDPVQAAGREILKRGSLPVIIRAEGSTTAAKTSEISPISSYQDQIPPFVAEYWKKAWTAETDDLQRLSRTHRPPTGNMPCVIYACFNLFWLGEELQVLQKLLREQGDKVPDSKRHVIAALLRHHAMRLEKWEMMDSASFLRQLADFLLDAGLSTKTQASTLEMSWIAINRMQSCIDAAIPWTTLDENQRAWNQATGRDIERLSSS